MPLLARKPSIESIADKVFAGRRITADDALALFEHPNLLEIACLADARRQQKVPGRVVTYVVGRILNYTNICWVGCSFCAFHRRPGDPEGYLLSDDQILAKVADTVDKGGVEILFQGGLNPKLKIDWYEKTFSLIKREFPGVILHALSPAEITYIAKISRLTVSECLARLKAVGLNSIPGAGGEILVDAVREKISPYKNKTDEWLDCMRSAAALGIKSSASMMYGHVETFADRVEHLCRIRELQDECEPFRAFICWPFQPEETKLAVERKATSWDYLRTQAIARIFLDNVPNVQLSILTQGPKVAQIALGYGANDFGSVMIEENVVSAAGSKFIIDENEFRRLIWAAGYEPRRRNTRYEFV